MKKYTINEFKNYLNTQDSLGDIHYNLNEKSIDKANATNSCEFCIHNLNNFCDIDNCEIEPNDWCDEFEQMPF